MWYHGGSRGDEEMKLLNYVLAFDYSKYFIMIGRSLLILLFFKVLKMIVTFITTKWVRRSKTRFKRYKR